MEIVARTTREGRAAPRRETVAGGEVRGQEGERLFFCPPLIIADPFPKLQLQHITFVFE